MTTLTFRPAPVFRPLWEAQNKRFYGRKGGRASGKSHDEAEFLIAQALARPGLRVLCGREVQKSLKESAKKLIEDKIEEKGGASALGFEILQTEIRGPGGGLFMFAGLKDHTVDSIKSIEGVDIAWIEEAQSLSERSIKLLLPTIRKEGSQIHFTWNPRRRSDPVERLIPWHDKERAVLVHANYTDNPFLPQVMLDEAASAKQMDPDDYAHVWLGGYETMGSKVVIPAAWIEAAVGLAEDLGLSITGKRYAALDVAGGEDGGDENALAIRHGIELQSVDGWNGLDGELTLQRALRACARENVTSLMYDPVGVGESVTTAWAGMGRRGERPHGVTLTGWNGGAGVLHPDQRTDPRNPKSPKNKDQYHNLKAQGGFALRKRFENAWLARQGREYDRDMLISIPRDMPDLTKLTDELTQPQHKLSATGKTMIDKAPDGAKSPNWYDAVMMAFWPIETSYDMSFWRS